MKAVYEVFEKSYWGDKYTEAEVTIWDNGSYVDSFDAPTDITSIDELIDFVSDRYEFTLDKFKDITEWEIK
jgi:hypothetical protein